VVFNLGMGVDSVAILLRYLTDPASRDFDLADMVVITAMTGDEWESTGTDIEQHLLPLLREHRVRFVQVARTQRLVTVAGHGVAVLSDTDYPTRVHLEGAYKLSQEMLEAGTIPQSGGARLCSVHAKGDALDPIIAQLTGGRPYRQIIGFEANEPKRAAKDAGYNTALRTGVYPLIEWGWDRDRCVEFIASVLGGVVWEKSACVYCLAGDTEVVTRQGIRKIRELAGGRHDLLIPQVGTKGGLGTRGSWRTVDVLPFGKQRLYAVNLRRGRSTKTVHATAEHRWILAPVKGAQWKDASEFETTTSQLGPGMGLRNLQAAAPAKEKLMAFAVAQGFVYGDGTKPGTHRADVPASLAIYDNGKDKALLPYFAACEPRLQDDGTTVVYPLPRTWKQLPTLTESRSFLLSWLAGYFAADGTVSQRGIATLYSADRRAIEFARDVAAVCGVGYTPIRSREREGFGKISTLWQINLTVRDLPAWFFILDGHNRRAAHLIASPADRQPWRVVSIEETDRVEEVFCAVVPGAQAFGLAEDLMTGNCPFALANKDGRARVLARYAAMPSAGADTLFMEHVALALNPAQGLVGGKRAIDMVREAGHHHVIAALDAQLDETPHAVYEVRRILRGRKDDPTKFANASRAVVAISTGSRTEMLAELPDLAASVAADIQVGEDGISRIYTQTRAGSFPTVEKFYVVAPAVVKDKADPKFEGWWADAELAVLRGGTTSDA
jgi:hypothetical protein